MADRAVPNNCANMQEFGFVRPCRRLIGASVKSGLKNLGYKGLLFGLFQVSHLDSLAPVLFTMGLCV